MKCCGEYLVYCSLNLPISIELYILTEPTHTSHIELLNKITDDQNTRYLPCSLSFLPCADPSLAIDSHRALRTRSSSLSEESLA